MNKEDKYIGTPVTNIWNGTIRYGVVMESKESNNWMYLKCNWIDDDAYEHDRETVCRLRGLERDESLDWIRVDKVKFINIQEHINKLSKLSFAVKEVDGSVDYSYYLTDHSNSYAVLT
tara:strand:- start:5899 stop:6252 length:354 start_codon:yes stop_codon:yes gene_type:complete